MHNYVLIFSQDGELFATVPETAPTAEEAVWQALGVRDAWGNDETPGIGDFFPLAQADAPRGVLTSDLGIDDHEALVINIAPEDTGELDRKVVKFDTQLDDGTSTFVSVESTRAALLCDDRAEGSDLLTDRLAENLYTNEIDSLSDGLQPNHLEVTEMTTQVPDTVAAAAQTAVARVPNRVTLNGNLRRGDLRLITPTDDATGEARLGLVLNVTPWERFTEIALVHTYLELVTSTDGVVPHALAGTPFDVVVQTEMRGIVWAPAQALRLVGQLSEETLKTIWDLVATGQPESASGIRTGTPLSGPHDRRWSFKATEGQALRVLASDCTGEVLRAADEGRRPIVNPGRREPA